MTQSEWLDRIADVSERRMHALNDFADLDREWRKAILSAVHDGVSATELARVADVSRARIYQIRDGRR